MTVENQPQNSQQSTLQPPDQPQPEIQSFPAQRAFRVGDIVHSVVHNEQGRVIEVRDAGSMLIVETGLHFAPSTWLAVNCNMVLGKSEDPYVEALRFAKVGEPVWRASDGKRLTIVDATNVTATGKLMVRNGHVLPYEIDAHDLLLPGQKWQPVPATDHIVDASKMVETPVATADAVFEANKKLAADLAAAQSEIKALKTGVQELEQGIRTIAADRDAEWARAEGLRKRVDELADTRQVEINNAFLDAHAVDVKTLAQEIASPALIKAADEELQALRRQGWTVVHEQIVETVSPSRDREFGNDMYTYRYIRLERRAVAPTAPNKLEAYAATLYMDDLPDAPQPAPQPVPSAPAEPVAVPVATDQPRRIVTASTGIIITTGAPDAPRSVTDRLVAGESWEDIRQEFNRQAMDAFSSTFQRLQAERRAQPNPAPRWANRTLPTP